jgi:hypothetical protein
MVSFVGRVYENILCSRGGRGTWLGWSRSGQRRREYILDFCRARAPSQLIVISSSNSNNNGAATF